MTRDRAVALARKHYGLDQCTPPEWLVAVIMEAAAVSEQDRKDAERYRWMVRDFQRTGGYVGSKERLDAEVDDALRSDAARG